MKINHLKHVEQQTHCHRFITLDPHFMYDNWTAVKQMNNPSGCGESGEGREWEKSALKTSQTPGEEKNKQTEATSPLNKHNSPSAHKHSLKSEVMERPAWINTAVAICPALTILAGTKSSRQTTTVETARTQHDWREKTGFTFNKLGRCQTEKTGTHHKMNFHDS